MLDHNATKGKGMKIRFLYFYNNIAEFVINFKIIPPQLFKLIYILTRCLRLKHFQRKIYVHYVEVDVSPADSPGPS